MLPLPSLAAAKWIAMSLGAVALLAAGAYGGYRWELGAYNGLKAANVAAVVSATKQAMIRQAAIDAGNQKDAEAEAYFRGQLAATIINLKSGAPANVTIRQDQQAAAADHAGCVTFGFARLLYAGAHGISPESLAIPSGQSVDACTALDPSDLAAAVAQDLAAGYANGDQLTRLIGAVRRNDAIVSESR